MDNHIGYHLAVLRYRHDLTTDEFINIGILMYITDTNFIYYKINLYNSRMRRFFLLSLNQTKNILKIASNRLKQLQENDSLQSIENAQKTFANDPNGCFIWSNTISGIIEDPNFANINKRLEYHFNDAVMKYY